MKPYYEEDGITLFHGDCRDVLSSITNEELWTVITDPPYPNRAGHFTEQVGAAEEVLQTFSAQRFFVFWHQLSKPPVPLPLVAHHVWHRTNTNRPDNYEAIYEFADEAERSSMVFPFAVIYPGLTGCTEANGHPTQKSLKLMQRLITLRDSQFILDPFAGSGSTLEAAKNLGRRAVGVELEERWCETAAQRLSQMVLDVVA